ncbi:MAG: hypothetical protein K2I10_14990 [Lachnospiraceae bacterium]|nr:hypothetical protein [Lachnospiraceae bacterium]
MLSEKQSKIIEKIVDRYHADYFTIMGYEIDIVDGNLYYIKEHHEPIVSPKYGMRHRRLKRAVTAGVPCPFREQGRSTAGNMLSAACVSAFFVKVYDKTCL